MVRHSMVFFNGTGPLSSAHVGAFGYIWVDGFSSALRFTVHPRQHTAAFLGPSREKETGKQGTQGTGRELPDGLSRPDSGTIRGGWASGIGLVGMERVSDRGVCALGQEKVPGKPGSGLLPLEPVALAQGGACDSEVLRNPCSRTLAS